MSTAPVGQVISGDGPGLDVRPAAPAPIDAVTVETCTVLLGDGTEVVAACSVVVGPDFLGLRGVAGRLTAAEPICAPACCRRPLTPAAAPGRIISTATARTSKATMTRG